MRRHRKASAEAAEARPGSRPAAAIRRTLAIGSLSREGRGSSAPAALALALLALLALFGVASAVADTAPTPTIAAPTNVAYTTAHLAGEVNPNGGPSIAHWRFEYSTDKSSWTELPDHELSQAESEESSPIAIEEDLANGTLAPNTTYFIRLAASNEGGESPSSEVELTTKAVAKPTVTIEAPVLVSAQSGTYSFAGHVDPGGTDPAFETHWHFSCSSSCNGLQGGTVGPDESSHLVEGQATGLQPNTPYTVTLHAENQGGEETAEATFTTPAVAPVVSLRPTALKQLGAIEVYGIAEPRNSPLTDCHFDYGTTTAYGASAPCEILDQNRKELVQAPLSGLAPATTYHFRLEATNAGGTSQSEVGSFETLRTPVAESCPNQQVRVEQHSTFLPDCRAYEQVSPADKNGGGIVPASFRTKAAANGEAFQFTSLQGFGDVRGAGINFEYLAHRTPSGWTTHAISPAVGPNSAELRGSGADNYYPELSPDLASGAFLATKPLPGATPASVEGVVNLYVRNDLAEAGAGHYQLATQCPRCEEPGGQPLEPIQNGNNNRTPFFPWLVGSSPDMGHLAFESTEPLTADTPPQSPMVEFFPGFFLGCGGKTFVTASSCAPHLYEYDHGSLRLAGILPDGSPADMSVAAPHVDHNYRVPGIVSDGSDGHTRIEFIQPTDIEGRTFKETTNPFEQFAFINEYKGAGNLFQRIDGAETVQLNLPETTECLAEPELPQCKPVQAVYLDASADGERVFFESGATLLDGAAGGGIYMYDVTKPAGHRLTLVASIYEVGSEVKVVGLSEDGSYLYLMPHNQFAVWHEGTLRRLGRAQSVGRELNESQGNWSQSEFEARVTPDGRHLLVVSEQPPLPGEYDHSICGTGFGCHELYLYSADTNAWQCASCRPDGAPAQTGATDAGVSQSAAGATLGTTRLNRPLAAEGRYVFFNTAEALVPEDTNGAFDAYEYDTATGVISLLSSGTESTESLFLDADPEGKNVFIATTQPLVGYDTDHAYDVYDVRIGGGFPEPRPAPAPCEGESCQGTQTPPPAPAHIGSGLEGPGNPKPAKRRKHRRHHHHAKRRHHKRADNNGRAGR